MIDATRREEAKPDATAAEETQPPSGARGDSATDVTRSGPHHRVGKYAVVRPLGSGGMGVVLHARDEALNRDVAIKLIRPEIAGEPGMKERFFREARAVAALESDFVVPIYHVDEDGGAPFLVMPLLKGESLDDRLKAHPGPVPPEQAVAWAVQIASGLEAAHAVGLVHRDVKPANVWLDAGSGRARLLDFGLARPQSGGEQLTQCRMPIGTPAYMSPEQGRGDDVDGRTDLFSLGIVLYRCLTGKLPFNGRDPMSALIAVAMEEPPPPREVNPAVPPALSEFVMRLLEKDRDRRPATASAALQALRGLGTEAAPPAKPPRRRWPLVASAAAALAALLAAVVIFVQTPHGTVRVEVSDPAIEVTIDKDGPKITGAGADPIRLKVGEHGLTVKRGDLEFETKKFVVKKGETITLKVELLQGVVKVKEGDKVIGERELPAAPAKSRFPPLKSAWLDVVKNLPATARAEAVEEELRRRHPGVDPVFAEEATVEGGKVVRLALGKVSDLTPLAALPELQQLRVADVSALDDLSPLRGTKLAELDLGLPYTDPGTSAVADLAPLAGLPLRVLKLGTAKPLDLAPLAGVPLDEIALWKVGQGTDLAGLGRVKTLTKIDLYHGDLANLTALRGLRLTRLALRHCAATDLAPVAKMPLGVLDLTDTKVASLAPLKGWALTTLTLNGHTLSTDDLALVGSLPVNDLYLATTNVRSLEFLRRMKLNMLSIENTEVSDLGPLRDMPLISLWMTNTKVTDLSPLRGKKLTEIGYTDSPVKDVKALAGMELTQVWCTFDRKRDAKVLRAIKTLETINDVQAAEFWKKIDEGGE